MKRNIKVSLLLAALLILAGLWYIWPQSFLDTLPGFQKDEPVTSCSAILLPSAPENDPPAQVLELPPDSPEYQELMNLPDSTTYVRSPSDLLRLGRASDTQVINLRPCSVNICLWQGQSIFEFTLNGPNIVAEEPGGASRTYLPRGGKAFQEDVVRFLMDRAPEGE